MAVEQAIGIIDLKEPKLGSLGSVGAAARREILAVTPPDRVLSIALGELRELCSLELVAGIEPRFRYAKVGLSGIDQTGDWRGQWRRWAVSLPVGCRPVAVAYVDPESGAPPIEAMWDLAREEGAAAILLDTYVKRRTLLEHVAWESLLDLRDQAERSGILLVVAGGLNLDSIPRFCLAGFPMIAVRGLVCAGDRTAKLHLPALRRLRELLEAVSPASFIHSQS